MPGLKTIRGGIFHPWLGAFEMVCVRDGRPILLEEHWQALRRACAALEIKRPLDFRPLARRLPKVDGRWRWVIGPDGPSHSLQRESLTRRAGLTLTLSTSRVGSANLDARHKTLSYLVHWQARRENPAGEALLLNERGHIAGGAMSNLFWVRRGRLHTPDEECGCRAGVVRGWVLGQMEAKFARSGIAVLDGADEIFVTSSMLGICPVVRWQNRTLKAGPVTRILRDRYAQLVRSC